MLTCPNIDTTRLAHILITQKYNLSFKIFAALQIDGLICDLLCTLCPSYLYIMVRK